MEQVLRKLLDHSVKHLQALEGRGLIKFKVITQAGEEFGNLEIKPIKQKEKKRASLYPHGELRQYVLPMIKDVQPDHVVKLPVGKYSPETIRGNASSWCSSVWGTGSYSSTISKDKKHVEIYRFPV
jgi:methionyl-tRNA formyltransferase